MRLPFLAVTYAIRKVEDNAWYYQIKEIKYYIEAWIQKVSILFYLFDIIEL